MDDGLICGLHAVLAALQQRPAELDGLWVSNARTDRRMTQVLDQARAAGVRFHLVPRVKLDRMAPGERHQGVVARLRAPSVRTERDFDQLLENLAAPALLLVLDGVQDPHNLGACLRSADAAGVQAVIVPRERAAPLNAAARRAAAGAAETMAVYEVVNLARALERLKAAGVWLVGASQGVDTPLYAADLRGPTALVLGGEGKGLRRLTRELCDTLIGIPMIGHVESLNVSVAVGICLYEAMRQRRPPPAAR